MALTLDQELDRIKANKSSTPLGFGLPAAANSAAPFGAPAAPVAAPVTPVGNERIEPPAAKAADIPAPAPIARAGKTPEQIDAELGLPPSATNLPPAPTDDAGIFDVLGAAWKAETIRADAWNETAARRQALALEMFNRLPEAEQDRIYRMDWVEQGDWRGLEYEVTDAAGKIARTSPDAATAWAGYPLSAEAFNQQIDAARQADLDEAQTILDQPGGAIAEFFGTAARAITDETSLMLLPFGVSGSAWRTIASEALLGGVGEAMILPKEFRVAKELDLADPDPLSRIALGAVTGGAFSAALIGLGKGYRSLKVRSEARRASLSETKPDGISAAEHEANIDEAEAALRGDQTVQERLGQGGMGGGEDAPEGTLGAILATPPGDGIAYVGVAEAGNGYTVLVGPDGKAVRRVGSRNWRNNNPGNIEFGPFARSMGAIGTDGRFAVFPTYEQGRKAKATLLWGSKGYRGKTIGQAIARYAPSFENDTGAYTGAITKALGVSSDTPMASLTPKQREMMLNTMERVEGFKPGTENGAAARGPRKGMSGAFPDEDVPSYGTTSRGYTTSGQVTAGDGFRIDVGYEVVDASTLLRASGDLQPRDRSRMASDAWIADTAARLDPAQLMPSPTADRGAPIVGPDSVVESGNGRFAAIARAYERLPDRASAYRSAIEAAGFAIPEGVDRPVLIARRKTELTPAERSRFALEAQDSGVAVMTPTEMARAQSRAMTSPTLARLDPGQPIRSDANADFVRAVLQALPRSARNAMFDAGGLLNAAGERQLREALFARAWPDPDILARYAETDAGDLKSLMQALEQSAPGWAALKADIEAGLVRPEMDISSFVLDAMRLIGNARDLAAREQARRAVVPKGQRAAYSTADAINELLDEIDLLEGPLSPLTAALVRKFWKGGSAAPADEVASFLSRYAADARKAGASGGLLDDIGPRDVLRAIDKDGFGDLPEDLGQARGYAQAQGEAPAETVRELPGEDFDAGARSPEAEAADAEIEAELRVSDVGAFGPIHRDLQGKPQEAIDRLLADRDGDAIGVLSHPDVEQPIDLVYGRAPGPDDEGFGLAKIAAKHPEVLADLQGFLSRLRKDEARSGPNRIRLTDDAGQAVVRLDFDDRSKTWLMTAYEKRAGRDATTDTVPINALDDTAGQGTDTSTNIGDPPLIDKAGDLDAMADASGVAATDAITAMRSDLGDFAEFEIELADGTKGRPADFLDDLDADRQADAFVQACATLPAGVAA